MNANDWSFVSGVVTGIALGAFIQAMLVAGMDRYLRGPRR